MGQIRTLEFAEGTSVAAPTDFGAASGSGSGETNLILNPNGASALDATATNAIGDWVDISSGTTASIATVAGEIPLYSFQETAIKILNEGSGTGYTRVRFEVPTAFRNRKLKLSWEQVVSSSPAYASGDYKVDIYNYSDNYLAGETRLSLSTDASAVTSIPAMAGKFTTTFDADSRQYYEARFVRVAGSASSFISLNEVLVGAGTQPQGAVVGEWTDYTPTATGWTKATTNTERASWRRVGSSMEIIYFYRHTSNVGAASSAGVYEWSLPSGYTVDTSVIGASASLARSEVLGTAFASDGTNTTGYPRAYTSTTIALETGSDTVATQFVGSGNKIATSATLNYSFTAVVPIAEWAGSGTVNLAQNDVEYASVGGTWDAASTTTVYGPAGSAIGGALTAARAKTITWASAHQVGHHYEVELSDDGLSWLPASGAVIAGNAVYNVTSSVGTLSTGSGVYMDHNSSTTSRVYFARYQVIANDDTPVTDWTTGFWRVKRYMGGAAVGFGLASTISAGLVNPYTEGSGVVYSGSYTPTLTNTTNIAASASGVVYYLRVGKMVQVYGTVDIDPTAAAPTVSALGISLPIASAFTSLRDASGTAVGQTGSVTYQAGIISADAANDRVTLSFNATDTANRTWTFSFMYQII
jgi:hypothetical protein